MISRVIDGLINQKWIVIALGLALAFGAGGYITFRLFDILNLDGASQDNSKYLSRSRVAETVGKLVAKNEFPSEYEVNWKHGLDHVQVQYGLSNTLQEDMEDLFDRYDPDFGAFVAMDARTGKVLAMVSHVKDDEQAEKLGNLAIRPIFPAASVFKIVTATAAIDKKILDSDSVIPFNGSTTTLYKRNVESEAKNRWTRFMPLRQAFAHSVNTVFGKIGAYYLNPDLISEYASRFGFNQRWKTDIPVEWGRTYVAPNDQWQLVEIASGFNTESTLTPLQGAMMAASVANKGVMMKPYFIEKLTRSKTQEVIYEAEPDVAKVVMAPETSVELTKMMEETIRSGTSRKVFRPFSQSKKFKEIEVGGKTGSLTASEPHGKCDWFVSFAQVGDDVIAMAALTVHEKYWKVKSAYLARRFIELYSDRDQSDLVSLSR